MAKSTGAGPSPAAAKTERLLNLVIALLHTRQPLSRVCSFAAVSSACSIVDSTDASVARGTPGASSPHAVSSKVAPPRSATSRWGVGGTGPFWTDDRLGGRQRCGMSRRRNPTKPNAVTTSAATAIPTEYIGERRSTHSSTSSVGPTKAMKVS